MPNDSIDLRFGPTSSNTGFSLTNTANFGDLRPETVVRELIQNSLDAAVEAEEQMVIVRFRLTRIKTNDIPGIDNYRDAFEGAVKSHKDDAGGKLPSQAANVVRFIKNALVKDKLDTLFVLDNGIGLNKAKMDALLSDGVSAKSEHATGSYGIGHFAGISASDLRYALYGGITEDGNKIGAGHAVLASRKVQGKDHRRSGDGFLIHGFQDGAYVYAQDSSIPNLIAGALEDIQDDAGGRGTAVIIPGFNNFREDKKTLWELVSKAAACNFFQAIEEGRLTVWVEDLRPEGHDDESLDNTTLKGVLEKYRAEKRSKSFLSGQKAFEAHDVLRSGRDHTVPTSIGEIHIKLLIGHSNSHRVDLCRNGMWITYHPNISGFQGAFTGRQPFHALLLVDTATTGERLHKLFRDAEGPLHEKLDLKRLSRGDAKVLRAALKEIREWLKNQIPEVGSDSYTPDDFLTLDFGDDEGTEGGKARRFFWGMPTPVSQRINSLSSDLLSSDIGPPPNPGPGPGPGPGPHPHPHRRPRPTLRDFFSTVAIPSGPNRRSIHLECYESCENAEFQLRVDENIDATCDHQRVDEFAKVLLKGVKVNGLDVQGNKLVRENGQVVGVRLGDLAANTSVRIDTGYQLHESLSGVEPALRVEVFKASSSTDRET